MAIFCFLIIQRYISTQKINYFEYSILILFALLGIFFIYSSNDLLTAYLSIELQSLSFYIMASIKKDSVFSVDVGLKYFILGAFSSSLFLFTMILPVAASGRPTVVGETASGMYGSLTFSCRNGQWGLVQPVG